MPARYDGPIIDCHHHLWDLSLGRHDWLTGGSSAMQSLGDLSFLRKDYLIADYLGDVGAQPVMGSVFVEAVANRVRPVEEEADWVAALARPVGIAARCVAWAPLRASDVRQSIETLAARPSVVGLRETIRWHPDPAKRWAEAGLLDDPGWRHGVALLPAHGLHLEVLMNPYQADDVVRLAQDMPGLGIVVNHCGSPMDRDAEGMARWKRGLVAMGRCPNVTLKLSNFGTYATDHSVPALADVVRTCLDAFGPGRAMFGTDYPVARRIMTYQDICERMKDVLADLSAADQRAIFYDNAAILYRFGTGLPGMGGMV